MEFQRLKLLQWWIELVVMFGKKEGSEEVAESGRLRDEDDYGERLKLEKGEELMRELRRAAEWHELIRIGRGLRLVNRLKLGCFDIVVRYGLNVLVHRLNWFYLVRYAVVRRRGGAIDGMRQRGRRRREADGEGQQGAAPEVGPQHPGFPGGPTDTSLLIRYLNHVACHLWLGEERRPKPTLKVAAHGSKLIGWVPYTRLARVDTHLLSSFVERWHPETSSFHMPLCEMTITLDDVSCLLHVPIRGELVDPDFVVTDYDSIHNAVELFGVSLSEASEEASSVRGPYYKLDWLKQVFEQQRAANNFTGAMRAYMMLLLGCTILADKTFTLVEAKYLPLLRDLNTCGRYCWGAAALVTLYRYLGDASFYSCKQLGGYASLLQCWIHEYFPTVGKRGTSRLCGIDSPMARAMKSEYRQGTQKVADIRAVLDQLTSHDIVWRPFEDHREHRPFDDICLFRGGLKWYGTVVLYLPDRFMRQFGYRQYIPIAPSNVDTLDVDVKWATYMQSVLQVIRFHDDPPAAFATIPYETDDDYLAWYYTVSHPLLRAPRGDQPMEVPVPVYDEGPSDLRLSYISHELHH
ncbi:protein MAIN-LIKE 1-like [Vicia villosa]|uniref:protein MAIN-LIKE 1-like n=1 Tax=Vicia villosa TaxID=3911 RepID=UPI00273AE9D8|nr:protein MAIN-LIKE 1-like [Vicia villosa]